MSRAFLLGPKKAFLVRTIDDPPCFCYRVGASPYLLGTKLTSYAGVVNVPYFQFRIEAIHIG